MCYGQVTCKINCTEWREHSNHPSKKEKKTLNHESKCATEEVKKQKLASLFHDKIWLLFCSHCWYYIIHWWLRQVLGQCLLNKQQGITYNFRSCHSLASPYFFKMRPQRKVCWSRHEAMLGNTWQHPVLHSTKPPHSQSEFQLIQEDDCIGASYVQWWCAAYDESSEQEDKRTIYHPGYLLKRLR